MANPLLQVIIASTRPGRLGPAIADWFHAQAKDHGRFEVEVIDLAAIDLPLLDEPHHPRLGHYVHEHTRRWSGSVIRADAFVVVTPEYNYGYNAVIKNAIDYLHAEWAYKAIGFVSYGGIAAGTRAVQMLKQVVTTVKMVPVFESVNIPFVQQIVDDGGQVTPTASMNSAAVSMLDELGRWTEPLRSMRSASTTTATTATAAAHRL